MKKQNIHIDVYKGSAYGCGLDGTLKDAIESLQALLEQIPEEYQKSAHIEVDYERSYYDDVTVSVEISYVRPETNQEAVARIKREEAAKENFRNIQMRQLEDLKKKLGIE